MIEKTPIPTLEMLRERREDLLQVAARRGVKNVRVFGSVARGEAEANSDIDLLVDLPPHFSLLDFSGLVREMQEVVGYRVEIASAAHLREEMREGILQEAEPL
ncbi:MAG: DNA polymerase beta domain-containing protein [Chloroflexi bacterium OLB15]|nr:MAG: DNA polymerase beta domain-containing protein [Chloroflexi bacterium OLB15]